VLSADRGVVGSHLGKHANLRSRRGEQRHPGERACQPRGEGHHRVMAAGQVGTCPVPRAGGVVLTAIGDLLDPETCRRLFKLQPRQSDGSCARSRAADTPMRHRRLTVWLGANGEAILGFIGHWRAKWRIQEAIEARKALSR
jgi:hypothetical protein